MSASRNKARGKQLRHNRRIVDWLGDKDIEQEFSVLDIDGDGQVSRQELQATGLPPQTIDSLLHRADKDGNGRVSLDELMELSKVLQEVESLRAELQIEAQAAARETASPTNSPPTDGATVMVQGMCFKYSNYTERWHCGEYGIMKVGERYYHHPKPGTAVWYITDDDSSGHRRNGCGYRWKWVERESEYPPQEGWKIFGPVHTAAHTAAPSRVPSLFELLSNEEIERVLASAGPSELCNFALTCRLFRALASANVLWLPLFHGRFGVNPSKEIVEHLNQTCGATASWKRKFAKAACLERHRMFSVTLAEFYGETGSSVLGKLRPGPHPVNSFTDVEELYHKIYTGVGAMFGSLHWSGGSYSGRDGYYGRNRYRPTLHEAGINEATKITFHEKKDR